MELPTGKFISKLREVESLLDTGQRCATHLADKEYGGVKISQAKCIKEVGKENKRLRKLVADLSQDSAICKEVSRENF